MKSREKRFQTFYNACQSYVRLGIKNVDPVKKEALNAVIDGHKDYIDQHWDEYVEWKVRNGF